MNMNIGETKPLSITAFEDKTVGIIFVRVMLSSANGAQLTNCNW